MQELDFELEAANSLRCQAHLLHPRSKVRGRVVVPRIQQGMVSKRVLAMEFVEGIKVTDRWVHGESLLIPVAPAANRPRTRSGWQGALHCSTGKKGKAVHFAQRAIAVAMDTVGRGAKAMNS